MNIDFLYRVYTHPIEHLGCRSLSRLRSFRNGYVFAQVTTSGDVPFEDIFFEWIVRIYRPPFFTGAMDEFWIIERITHDDELGFDLYFEHLSAALAAHPEVLTKVVDSEGLTSEMQAPMSVILDGIADNPSFTVMGLSPGCLRAYLDGTRLAYLENGRFDLVNLEGFEHWLRPKLELKGMYRWENAALAKFRGNKKSAFDWCLGELLAYRDSLGLASARDFDASLTSKDGDATSKLEKKTDS